MTAANALGPYKDVFQKYFNSLGLDKYLPLFKLLGFQWLPDILFREGKINNLLTVAGASVSTMCFLLSAEVFGMEGFLIYSMLFGAGCVAGSLVCLTDVDRK